jgi:threonine synthase
MQFYSLHKKAPLVDFRTATIHGQAPDGGLYFPEAVPFLPNDFINEINYYSKEEIALQVISPYVGNAIPRNELQRIAAETVAFDFPLVNITEDISSLELFHGPTLAFKDVGARFMSRCLGYFMQGQNGKVTVLVATSGDTGGAVANGFYGVDGVDVVILYPSGKVSPIQELQLTTLGKNITALEVAGRFDDCQQMVKAAFADADLQKALFLTSANSINVARWLPQQFYYFYAWQQWADKDHPPVISVPSGNFGNICAGILAHQSGLPVQHFIAACNANDIVPQYLKSGTYQSREAVATLSNAMDVGNPSNFVRVLEIFKQEFESLKGKLHADTITDRETKETLARVYRQNAYLLDPHGAVGYLALERYLHTHPDQKGYLLETAHPVKFPDAVEEATEKKIAYPESVQSLVGKPKQSILMEPHFNALKEYLLSVK